MKEPQPDLTPQTPEKIPAPTSPELEKAKEKLHELRDRFDVGQSIYERGLENSIAIWGSQEDMAPIVKEYHSSVHDLVKALDAELHEAELIVKKLEASALAQAEAESSNEVKRTTVLDKVAQLENQASHDPAAEKKVSWFKKYGKKATAALAGISIMIGVAAVADHYYDQEETHSEVGVSQVSDSSFEDLVRVEDPASPGSNAETEGSIEGIRDYEVADYGFLSHDKQNYYDLGAPMDILDVNGEVVEGTPAEHREIILAEAEIIGKQDPLRTAMDYQDIFNNRNLSNNEQLKDLYNSNPEAWQNAHEQIMKFWEVADIEVVSLEGESYHSVYGVLGDDNTPELRLSYIENGNGTAIIGKAALLQDGSIVSLRAAEEMGVPYMELNVVKRADCGGQSIDLKGGVITGLPEYVDLDPNRPWDVEIDIPETPGPETPDPEDPGPETPGPEDPDPNPKKPTEDINANPDLPGQLEMGEDRMDAGDIQSEEKITTPSEEYVPPSNEPSYETAPGATEITQEEREEETQQSPTANEANSVIDQSVQEQLRESGAGQLETNEDGEAIGNDDRVDG